MRLQSSLSVLTVVGWSLPRDALKKQTTIIFSVTLHMAGYTTARINAIDRRSSITWLSLFQAVSFSPFFSFQKMSSAGCCFLSPSSLLDRKIWITKHNVLPRKRVTVVMCTPQASFFLSLFVVAFPVCTMVAE